MRRRHFLYAGALAMAAPAVRAQSARERTLKLVPLTSLYSLDTVFNTSLVTTNHGWAVYDFALRHEQPRSYQAADGRRPYLVRGWKGLRDQVARRSQIS